MGKKSRTKRERREGKLVEKTKPVCVFDTMLTVPADMIISSLLLKFIGKSGYKYISISRYGSLFVNEEATDIVPVMLHREFPELSVRGRYNDPNRNDIVLYAVHVPSSFSGLIIDKHANVYLTGNQANPATEEEIKAVLCDLTKVTAEEFNHALELEKPLMENTLKQLHEEVEAAAKQGIQDIDKAEEELKEEESVQQNEPNAEEADVLIPGEETRPTDKEMAEVKDAEEVVE